MIFNLSHFSLFLKSLLYWKCLVSIEVLLSYEYSCFELILSEDFSI